MGWTVEIHPRVEKFMDKHLSPEDRVRVLELFDRLEAHGTKLGRPDTRQIEGKLWELRPQTTRGSWRFLYVTIPPRCFCVVMGMRHRSRITEKMKKTAYNRSTYCEEEA